MKPSTKGILLILPILSTLLLISAYPLQASYYAMPNLLWKIFYIISLYGIAFWVIIPSALIGLLLSLVPSKKRTFKQKFIKAGKITYLVFSILLLMVFGAFSVSKYFFEYDQFETIPFENVIETKQDLTPIKNGKFKAAYGVVIRNGDNHEVKYNDGHSEFYKVIWTMNGEYHLIPIEKAHIDTLKVKVVNIESDFYECYYNYGGLAEYDRLEIIK